MTAVLGICILHRLEQLLSVYEVQERVGAREGRKEGVMEQQRDEGDKVHEPHLESKTYIRLHG